MIEEREHDWCTACGGPIVRITYNSKVSLLHSYPDSESALLCALNPDALPKLTGQAARPADKR
jgi:hypothetical protein